MLYYNITLLFTYFILFSLSGAAHASAWNKEQGTGVLISTTQAFESDQFGQISSGLFLEYGVTDRLTLGTKLDYASQEYRGDFPATATGFTAVELFAQRQIFRTDNSTFALRMTYAAPTQVTRELQLEEVSYNELAYGNAIETTLTYGHGLDEWGEKFFSIETGYRHALGNDASRIKLDITAGIKPSDRWLFMLKSFNTISLQNQTFFGADYDVYRIEPSIVFTRKNFDALSLAIVQDIGGRNLDTGTALQLNFWKQF